MGDAANGEHHRGQQAGAGAHGRFSCSGGKTGETGVAAWRGIA
jgi:hypothetical protein